MDKEKSKKYGTLIKDTLIFALGSIGSKFMLFILVPLYTNCLTPDEYGTAELIFTIAQLIIPLLSLTVFDAVLRFGLSKDYKANDVLACAFLVWGVASIISVAITPLFGFYDKVAKWKWYLCGYTIVQMLFSIEQNYLKTVGKNKLYAFCSLLQALVLALLNIVLLLFVKMRVEGYLLANIFASLLVAVFTFFIGGALKDLKTAKLNKTLLKKMLVYSSPLILNNISWWGIQSANKILVEIILGASVLGVYTVATKIPALINVIITIFSQSWGISTIREVESTDDTSFYSSVFSVYTFLAIGACIAIVTIIKPFMTIYVGAEFVSAWVYVPILLVSAVFSAISGFCGSLYGALKKSVNNMISTLISAIVCVGVTLLLINSIGLWSAIIGTLLSYLTIAIIRLFDTRRFIKFKIDWLRFLLSIAIMSVQTILVTIEWHGYLVSAVAIVLFLAVNAIPVVKFLRSKKER